MAGRQSRRAWTPDPDRSTSQSQLCRRLDRRPSRRGGWCGRRCWSAARPPGRSGPVSQAFWATCGVIRRSRSSATTSAVSNPILGPLGRRRACRSWGWARRRDRSRPGPPTRPKPGSDGRPPPGRCDSPAARCRRSTAGSAGRPPSCRAGRLDPWSTRASRRSASASGNSARRCGRRRGCHPPDRPWARALHRRPGVDQGAVDREVVATHLPADLGMVDHAGEQFRRRIQLEEAIPVLGEGRRVPHRIVAAEADEPSAAGGGRSISAGAEVRRPRRAKQEIEGDPIDQLTLRADRIGRLQQQGPRQLLRRDRRPADRRVGGRELLRHAGQHRVGDPSDQPQRMPGRHPRLAVDGRKQAAVPRRHAARRPLRRSPPTDRQSPHTARTSSAAC